MKKIGVISDPHANLEALRTVLEDMPDVDKIICAGDLVNLGPQPNEVIDLIKNEDILTVLGNHDHAVIENDASSFNEEVAESLKWTREELTKDNLNFLKDLSKTERLEEEDYEIFIAHGTPRKPLKEYLYPGTSNRALMKMTKKVDTDVIVLGHTHVPLKRTIQSKRILNPGSVGQPRDRNPKASYSVIELGDEIEGEQYRVSYDIEKTKKKIEDFDLPEKLGIRLEFGW